MLDCLFGTMRCTSAVLPNVRWCDLGSFFSAISKEVYALINDGEDFSRELKLRWSTETRAKAVGESFFHKRESSQSHK